MITCPVCGRMVDPRNRIAMHYACRDRAGLRMEQLRCAILGVLVVKGTGGGRLLLQPNREDTWDDIVAAVFAPIGV